MDHVGKVNIIYLPSPPNATESMFLKEETLTVQVSKKECHCIPENLRKFYKLNIRGDLVKEKKSNQRKLKLKQPKEKLL